MKVSWIAVLVFSFLVLSMGGKPSFAQGEIPTPDGRRYFPETGHFVSKEFLQEYESIAEPELIYGYPLTKAYFDPDKNRLIQYFENARFEYVPENPPELRVVVSELGWLMYEPGQTLPSPGAPPACRNYPETRMKVCYAFLDYFDKHGGVGQFGYPISNFEVHEQRIVQYFQRARFEWHPELPAGQRVQLTDLGRRHFFLVNGDPELYEAEELFDGSEENNRAQVILNLNVRANADKPVHPSSGNVTIDITVRDQNLLPVEGATITMTVTLPSGEVQRIFLNGRTNKHGIGRYTVDFSNEPMGIAEVNVKASYDNFEKMAVTSFRIWR
jgi:hypothetical protein